MERHVLEKRGVRWIWELKRRERRAPVPGGTAQTFLFLLLLAAVFVDAFEHFAHVLDLLEERVGDIERFFLRRSERKAITRARIDLDQLSPQFVLLLKNEPRKVCGILQLGNDGALDRDVEPLEDAVHQVVRQRTLFRRIAQKHPNNHSHVVLDLNDEDLLVVADENRAPAVRRQDPANLNGHNVTLHGAIL